MATSPTSMNNGPEDGDATSPSRGSGKRQRAKQACEPCRLRKRRCDGAMPCNMCRQFEYKCYFEKHFRKRSKLVEQNAHHEHSSDYVRPEPPQEDRLTAEDTMKMRNMEANSGMAFVRLLGQRLDPSSGGKISKFAWNTGTHIYSAPAQPPITDFINQYQMYALAQVYIKEVHKFYGFIDKDWILQQITLRWAQPDQCDIPDHLLANLAAIGSTFSNAPVEVDVHAITQLAKRTLEDTSMMQPPTLIHIQSWLLRSMYLRLVDLPHASHTTSCMIMHFIEGAGLHEEVNNSMLHPAESSADAEIRRRTFWTARLFNTWISYEYGRTRVTLRGITTELPTPRENDHIMDYLNLYSITCSLDPERPESRWEDLLRKLDDYECTSEVINLSKANLGLVTYRRIRQSNPNPSPEIVDRIIKLGLGGLEAAQKCCERGLPWWHVPNVPFQAICVFLAIDVRESLAHIGTAMRVLEQVVERFPTAAMKEALKTARFLVRLSKRKKDEDTSVLGNVLKRKSAVDDEPSAETLSVQTVQPFTNGHMPMAQTQTPMTASSEDWAFDAANNPNFDWNFFLSADMPVFNGFAADAAML